MSDIQKLGGHSADIVSTNIEALQALFPEAFTEAKGSDGATKHKIDFEVLRQLLGDRVVTEGEGKYGLSWHGKDRARQLALTPSAGTLRPAPEESVDWDTTQNIMIEGDNLEVLKLLQKSYAGRVKLIYIDPPYNTGKDFVYPDDFRDTIGNYLTLTGQSGDGGGKLTSNPETSGRFHTDWLNMMYPRLKLARDLLRDDGVIAISIDDNEVANLRTILADIFGAECFIANVVYRRTVSGAVSGRGFVVSHDHILLFSKSKDNELNRLALENDDGYSNPDSDPRGPYKLQKLERTLEGARPTMTFAIESPVGPIIKTWAVSRDKFDQLLNDNRIGFSRSGAPYYKQFYSEYSGRLPDTWWDKEGGNNQEATKQLKSLMQADVFNNPKSVSLVEFIAKIVTNQDDTILDFFAGSGTTGQAVLGRNIADSGHRRYLLVQLPEQLNADDGNARESIAYCDTLNKPRTIAELTKERLRRAGAKIKAENPLFTGDTGFRVFKLDRSNIRAWDPDTKDLAASLLDSVNHLIPGRTDQDVLYEVLLKQGLDLCVPIQEAVISSQGSGASSQGSVGSKSGELTTDNLQLTTDKLKTDHRIWCIGGGVLFVCLSNKIDRPAAEAIADDIAKWHKKLAPATDTRLIFKDSGFTDDVAKTNLTAILAQHGLKDVRSI
jgi:adenine-specific DNA-methyltransferase